MDTKNFTLIKKKSIFLFILLFFSVFSFAQQRTIPFKSQKSVNPIEKPLKTIIDEGEKMFAGELSIPYGTVFDKKHEGVEFQLVRIDGYGLLPDVGKPALPVQSELIAVPNGSDFKIVITKAEFIEYDGYMIYPALKAASDSYGSGEPEFEIDEATYSTNEFYPKENAFVRDIQKIRGLPFATINVCPVQFNPVTKKLRVYSVLEYKIEFSGAAKFSTSNLSSSTPSFNNILKRSVSNPSIIPAGTNKSSAKGGERKDLIIITPEAYKAEALKLAEWKEQIGITVELVVRNEWSSDMVNFEIKDRYENWSPKPDYFLIIGDHDGPNAVPGNLLKRPGEPWFSSDNYYSCMDGEDDYTPDLARGRISVRSVEEAQIVIDKIIKYEKDPITNADFYNNALHCAYYQDNDNNSYADRRFCQTSEEIRNYLLANTNYTINRVYSTNSSNPTYFNDGHYANGEHIYNSLEGIQWFPDRGGEANIRNEWNAGKFYIFHRDHGYTGGRGWADPYFTLSSIDGLSNGDKLPVVFSINCHTGQFIETECFAEKLIRKNQGGAVGVFGAAQASYSGSNDALILAMFDAIWSDPGITLNFSGSGGSNVEAPEHDNITNMGDVLIYGLNRMNVTWPAPQWQMKYQCDLYHYFGDPTMEIRTETPKTVSATYPSAVACDATTFNITNCNFQKGRATIMVDGMLWGSTEITNGSGSMTIEPLGNSQNIVLTIYGRNTIPLIRNLSTSGSCNYAPIPDFKTFATTVGTENAVKFLDKSKYTPTQWNWSFSPNTVQFVNGTSSSSQNPEVVFTASGEYNVTLSATNSGGTNVTTKSNYLAVKPAPPAEFVINPSTSSVLNLSWTKNTTNDNVMIVYSTMDQFGKPEDGQSYSLESEITGGGTVCYSGSGSSTVQSNLEGSKKYFYRVYSYDGSRRYSLDQIKTNYLTPHGFDVPFRENMETQPIRTPIDATWIREKNDGDTEWSISMDDVITHGRSLVHDHNDNQIFDADSWLFTPALYMIAGKTYRISFKYNSQADHLRSSLKVALGNNPVGSAMNLVILEDNNFYYSNPQEFTYNYTPSSSGIRYLGFHHIKTSAYRLHIDDIEIYNTTDGHVGHWRGTVSNSWHNAANWGGNKIPDATTEVIIPEGLTTYPVITQNAACKNIVIENGENTLLTLNNGTFKVEETFQVGLGYGGKFLMNGGACLVDSGNFATNYESAFEINGGNLSLKRWVTFVEVEDDEIEFIRGDLKFSGGNILVKNDFFIGANHVTGVMDGPFTLTINGSYRSNAKNFTITGGTIILDNKLDKGIAVCIPSDFDGNASPAIYNLVVNSPEGDYRLVSLGNITTLKVVNDFTIVDGIATTRYFQDVLYRVEVGGNFEVKSCAGFNVESQSGFSVKGDFITWPGSYVENSNNISYSGSRIDHNPTQTPYVDFTTQSGTTIHETDKVQFNDNSSVCPDTYEWYFEGGTPSTSTEKNPLIQYNTQGTFRVRLVGTNSLGSHTATKEGYITVEKGPVPPQAKFTVTTSNYIPSGGSLSFVDQSLYEPTSWLWEFEGGTPATSTEQHPTIRYYSAGNFAVKLKVSNQYGSDVLQYVDYARVYVSTSPVAEFSVSNANPEANEQVTFTDESANSPTSWLWTFEGGTPATSTLRNPTVRFSGAGGHSVTLKATNSYGYDELTKTNFVVVGSGSGDTEAPSVPSNLTTSNITSNSVNLSWSASTDNVGVTGYDIYRNGSKVGSSTSTSYTVTGLSAGTNYSFTVKAKDAAGNESGASNAANATTMSGGDTEAPSTPANLTAGTVTETSVALSWTASTDNVGVTEYDIYRDGSKIGSSTTTSYNATGLTGNTSYSFYVKAKDAAGNESNASNTVNATTSSGGVTYCNISSGTTSYFWVNKVEGGSFSNESGRGSGYSDFTSQTINATTGTFNITLTPGYSGSHYSLHWKVWIDLNEDGDFTDSGEEVYVSSSSSNSPVNAGLTIPSSANGVNSRMRIVMSYYAVEGPCDDIQYGEIEDYTVSIGGGGEDTQAPTSPSSLTSNNVTTNSVNLNWNASTDNIGVAEYDIYRNSTKVGTSTSTNYTVTGLSAGTSYSFYVKAKDAAGNESGSSNSVSVTTQNGGDTQAPTIPTNLTVSNITTSSVDLSWNASTDNIGVTGYDIYRDGTKIGNSTSTNYSATGLSANTTYSFSIKAKDAAGNESGFSISISETTLNTGVSYCEISSGSVSYFWINKVEGGSFTYESGKGSGYSDFTSQTINATTGTFNITLTPGYSGSHYSLHWKVWIDLNEDGDFADSGEEVYVSSSSSNSPVNAGLTIPSSANGVNSRMRIVMSYYAVEGPCDDIQYGEIEDYTVSIGSGGGDTQAPTTPSSLTSSNVTTNSVNLSWNASSDNVGVTGYDIYRNGTNVGTSISTNYTVSGLSASTTYSFYVKAKDAAGNESGSSNTVNATTESAADTQAPTVPGSLSASNVTTNSVYLSWNASSDNVGVTGYDIYRNGTNLGTSTSTSYTVTGLSANTTYSFYVKAKDAAGNESGSSNTVNATTQSGADTQAPTTPGSLSVGNVTTNSVDLSWNASTDNVGVTGYDVYRNGTNVGTSTSTSYTVSGLSANTSYAFYVKAKDVAGNESGSSNTVNATTSGGSVSYCTADHGSPMSYFYISNVSLESINNSSTLGNSSNAYSDYTSQSTTLNIGSTYTISESFAPGWSANAGAAWIDWNGDGDFDDSGERVLNASGGSSPYSESFTVPASAQTGNTRMRVRLTYSATPVPCGSLYYGETEDYTISIAGTDGQDSRTYDVMDSEIDINVFPNPSSGSFVVRLSTEMIGDVMVNVYSIDGKLIDSQIANKQDDLMQINYNLNVESGMYCIQVILNQSMKTQTIIIE